MTGDTGGEITVVLAEDQEMVLGAFASLLQLQPDVRVLATTHTGEEALSAVRRHQPDVLLADIEMPRRGGLDVAEELAAAGSGTRVLIVTTFARTGYLQRAMRAGVAGYVLKDAPIADLVDALRRVYHGERVVDPELALSAWDGRQNPLTGRECEILREVETGDGNADIADRLNLAEGTVRNYLSTVLAKTNTPNRTAAARLARDHGWL